MGLDRTKLDAILNAPTPDNLEVFIDHLAVRSEELLAQVKRGLGIAGHRPLTVTEAHQLVADALVFNSLASQLAPLAHAMALQRLRGGS